MLLAHLILIISHYPRTHKHGPNCTVETQERDCGVRALVALAIAAQCGLPAFEALLAHGISHLFGKG